MIAAYIVDMVHVPDDARRRLEARRRRNGQFGEAPHTPPDAELRPLIRLDSLADLAADAADLRDEKAEAIAEYIDAAMPADTDYANYLLDPDTCRLRVLEACGDWGEEMDLAQFAHIDEALAELGEPYIDFDGDLLLNSLGDFGWERGKGVLFSQERLAAAEAKRQEVTRKWVKVTEHVQTLATTTLRQQMGDHIEVLELRWDDEHRRMWVEAAIHQNGRTEATQPDRSPWAECNEVAAYIRHPELAPFVRSELSGLYRLDRAAHIIV